jgi:tRNA-dihydrouridine synthase B
VTAKIRLGRTRKRITALEVARAVEEAGAAGLTIHGRAAGDQYSGVADWDRIAEVKSRTRLPIIGNGDVDRAEKAAAAFERYGVDGVMIGRAALARPWIFREAAALLRGATPPAPPSPAEQKALLLQHHAWMMESHGEERGTVLMRRYACQYAHGRRGAREFRVRAGRCSTAAQFRRAVEECFPMQEGAAPRRFSAS